MQNETNFAPYIKDVSQILFGLPNKKLSNNKEWRFGTNGSLSIDLEKGVWKNFETGEGGGVLKLIAKKKNISEKEAVEWLKENNFEIKDKPSEVQFIKAPEPELVATYSYTNALGELIYQVQRYEFFENGKKRKKFKQRKPDKNGGWEYSVKDVTPVPYNLEFITEAIPKEKTIFIVEGEKDVETLKKYGAIATTNSGGSQTWQPELNGYFAGANVCIIPDCDEAGRKHAQIVAKALKNIAASIKLLELPNLPEKSDVTDYFETGRTIEEFYNLFETRAIPYAGEEIFKSKFSALHWSDLDKPGFEHEWLIKGLLTRGERSMVAGPSQSGKSFAVLDLALSIARGVDYQAYAQIAGTGNFNIRSFKTRKGLVIYQCGEGSRGMKKRLKAYRKYYQLENLNDVPFVLLPAQVDLHSSEDHTKQLISEIKHWSNVYQTQLELVVIDTLSAATPGANENASEDMSRILARCEKIAVECNTHVMFVHHLNASGEKPRGHTSIFANLDNVLTVKRTEDKEPPKEIIKENGFSEIHQGRDIREVVLTKSKDGEDGTHIQFVLHSVDLGTDEDGDLITSCVCIPPQRVEGSVSIGTDKAIKLNDELLTTLAALKKAIEDYGIQAPKEYKLPENCRVVEYKYFKQIYSDLTGITHSAFTEEKKLETLESELRKNGKSLLSKGVITREKNHVWFTGKPVLNFKSQKIEPKFTVHTTAFTEKADDNLNWEYS